MNPNLGPQFEDHPHMHTYTDGGMGGDESRNVVGLVSVDRLSSMPGNWTEPRGVSMYRERLRSGQGFKEPVIVGFDPDSRLGVVGEGNHRVAAAAQEGVSHLPTRVVRMRGIEADPVRGARPRPLTSAPSPWKPQHNYWPSDIHPRYVFDPEDLR